MRGLWTHLERLGAGRMDGGIGTRGPGESQIETDRRLARDRISALRRRLVRVEQNRGVMRARRESAAAAGGRARRLHERRQVDPAERAHRRGGRRRRAALPHPRPDHPRLRARRPPLPGHRHGRVHPQAPASAGRGVQGDARGDPHRRPDRPRGRRVRSGPGARRGHRRGRRRCSTRSAPASSRACSSTTSSTCSMTSSAASCSSASPTRSASRRRAGRGSTSFATGSSAPSRRRCAQVELLVPYERGWRGSRSSTSSPATSSARSAPTASASRARIPAALAHRFAEFAVGPDGAPTDAA